MVEISAVGWTRIPPMIPDLCRRTLPLFPTYHRTQHTLSNILNSWICTLPIHDRIHMLHEGFLESHPNHNPMHVSVNEKRPIPTFVREGQRRWWLRWCKVRRFSPLSQKHRVFLDSPPVKRWQSNHSNLQWEKHAVAGCDAGKRLISRSPPDILGTEQISCRKHPVRMVDRRVVFHGSIAR